MKTWDYGINSKPEFMIGSVTLYQRPWWLGLVEWFALWVEWEWLHKVKLPKWPAIQWTPEDQCSPREWLGDVGCWVNADITNPLISWVYAHPRNRQIHLDLGYERVRELFYSDNPEMFDHEAGL